MLTNQIDQTDLKIIYLLDKNARTPYSSIAKEVRLSKQAVQKRVEKLISTKVISKFITIIRSSAFGFIPTQVFLSLQCSMEQKNQLVEELVNHPNVVQVATSEGSYGLFFGVTARSEAGIEEILSEIFSRHSSIINSKKIVHMVDTYLLPRDYLLGKKRELSLINRGFQTRKIFSSNFDELDKKIIKFLLENPRISFTKIAMAVGTSVQTVINKVKELEREKIILGYFIFLNEDIFIQHNWLLELSTASKEIENKLWHFLSSKNNAVFIVKTLGEFDFAITSEALTFKEYCEFSDSFKESFSQYLKSFTPLLVTRYPKLCFLPEEF